MPDARGKLMLKLFRLSELAGQDGAALEAALAGMTQDELEALERSLRRVLAASTQGNEPSS